ncbi:M14 family metallopeptidase [Acidipila sp. EB88]|uniref:M14 family metallopeptidase n=1 Tax=Acidipila sp. EB88 TaxID=2305226 RepID=UPI000F5F8A86|nr:M14 family metallopeptidase [Acidipila sp. EB88]RRA48757.1 peptidase M14 [Acidipila sp. EB88]
MFRITPRLFLQPTLAVAALCSLPVAATAQTASDWATPAEAAEYRTTPDYDATMAYLHRVQSAAPGQVLVQPFGETAEGRELDIVVASRDGVFDPARLHEQKRPIVLVQNAIHAGEMDGKDASMALLRDMVITKTQAHLLDRAVFVFIPVYNADGFANLSKYNRINQNGPELMGWRGNGTNLNLNRDYMKAQTPEARAFWRLFERWLPDFYVDNHVTDGADYQYDVTFAIDHGPDVDPGIAQYVSGTVTPELVDSVDRVKGHLAAPSYLELVDENDPGKGLAYFPDPPRYSCGAMVLENRPGMLVEMHMLKDYKTRVTGNYEVMAALFRIVNRDADKLIALNAAADAAAAQVGTKQVQMPLALAWDGFTTTPFLFKGYKYTLAKSEISGGPMVTYSHDPATFQVTAQSAPKAIVSTTAPAGYVIPRQWREVIDVLAAHGVTMTRLSSAWTGTVEQYQCGGMQWQQPPFEGKHPLFPGEAGPPLAGHFGTCTSSNETVTYPAGSVVVPLNQRLSKVAIGWLEPTAPDSAMAWGFFDAIFEQKEYGEPYVLEPLARRMLANDPLLKAEFESKLQLDPKFAASPEARLKFFYEHSPWFKANHVGLYPVGRLQSLSGVPVQP